MILNVSGIPYYITLNAIIILFEAMFITGFAVAEHFSIKEDIEVNETLHKIKTIKENGEQAK